MADILAYCRYSQTSVNNMTCLSICTEGRRGRPYTHLSTLIHAVTVCYHKRTNTFTQTDTHHCSLLFLLNSFYPSKSILSMSGHIAPLCHSNYSHKELSCESINGREGIRYQRMIGLYIKAAVGSLSIGILVPVIWWLLTPTMFIAHSIFHISTFGYEGNEKQYVYATSRSIEMTNNYNL